MVSTVFSILLAAFSAFVPVVLWGYAFSYLDADRFNARRFLLGAASGAVAVFPIAYMGELLDLLSLGRKNVFSSIAGGQGGMEAAFSLAVFLFFVALAVFLLGFVLRSVEIFKNPKAYFRSLFSVFLTVPIFFLLFSALPAVFPGGITEVRIAGAVIAGFASITLAYFVVAAVEEGGKHLWLFSSASMPSLLEKAPLYAVFAALGFAFAENSLYLFSLVRSESAVSTYVSTWFSRSLFSVVVHTLCSVVAVMPFFRALRRGDVGLAATYATVSGLLFAIAVHAAFDVSVSYGRNGVVFLYLVFAYVFVTRAFNRETASGRA